MNNSFFKFMLTLLLLIELKSNDNYTKAKTYTKILDLLIRTDGMIIENVQLFQ